MNRRIVTHSRPWGRPVVYVREAERVVIHVPGSRLPSCDEAPLTPGRLAAWWAAAGVASLLFWGGLFLLANLGWGTP